MELLGIARLLCIVSALVLAVLFELILLIALGAVRSRGYA
jgi:hypothetical protein